MLWRTNTHHKERNFHPIFPPNKRQRGRPTRTLAHLNRISIFHFAAVDCHGRTMPGELLQLFRRLPGGDVPAEVYGRHRTGDRFSRWRAVSVLCGFCVCVSAWVCALHLLAAVAGDARHQTVRLHFHVCSSFFFLVLVVLSMR